MNTPRLLRSMLFVPANNFKFIESAKEKRADMVILDLEDSVPTQEKQKARLLIKDAARLLKQTGKNVAVRINGLTTGLAADDLKFAICEGIDAIMLPKTESKKDIVKLERLMQNGSKGQIKIGVIPLVESAKGILNVNEIVLAGKRIVAIGFGAADYLRDLGRSYFTISTNEIELLYPRSRLALAARVADVLAIDTPFLGDLNDLRGLIRESRIALSLGFRGKMCIHPSHIEPINQVFSPSEKEVKMAKKIIKAYEQAKAKGMGAYSFEGRMIDEATYKMAKETLAINETIAKMSDSKAK
jgi:citrate lyase subunit beta/citryl-CoA lyase